MNFAFLIHPLGNETDRILAYIREVDLPKSFGWDMARLFPRHARRDDSR